MFHSETEVYSQGQVELLENTLSQWEQLAPDASDNDLSEHVGALKEFGRNNSAIVVPRLIGIAQDPVQGRISRRLALAVACELADSSSARLIANALENIATTIKRPVGGQEIEQDDFAGKYLLLVGFVHDLGYMLLDELHDHESIAIVASRTFVLTTLGRHRNSAAKLLAKCDVSQTIRDREVIYIVSRISKSKILPEILLDRVGSDVLNTLRNMLRDDLTPEGFHYTVAWAISYLGDQDVLLDLESARTDFRTKSRKNEARLEHIIWRITVQNPPEKLLDYISSIERSGNRSSRMWAVRLALSRDLSKESIRLAIIKHARLASEAGVKTEIPILKKLGLELGILQQSDLPEVVVRYTRPIP